MKLHFFIGIDISAQTFDVCFLVNNMKSEPVHQKFENSTDGINNFRHWLKEHHIHPNNATIVMENTGVYDDLLLFHMSRKAWKCHLLKTTALKKVSAEHRYKTDQYDAFKLAEYAIRYADTLTPVVIPDKAIEQLKSLYDSRQMLIVQRGALQTQIRQMNKRVNIHKLSVNALTVAADSLSNQIEHIEREMKVHIIEHTEIKQSIDLLTTVPGVGKLIAVQLFLLFWNSPKLDHRHIASWFGIAPYPKQSGTSIYSKPMTGKTGRKFVRGLLKMGARSVLRNTPVFKLYKEQKLKEGKPVRVIENNVANKIIRLVCGVWNSKTPCRFNTKIAA